MLIQKIHMNKGFTLLEVIMAVVVSSAVLLLVGAMLQKSGEGLEYFSSVGVNETVMERSLKIVGDEIIQTPASNITITSPNSDYDTLTIIRSAAGSSTEEIDTQFIVDTQTKELNQIVTRYTVDQATGIRSQKIDPDTGNPFPPIKKVIAINIDGADNNGNKGFSVSRLGTSDLFHITCRIRVNGRHGTSPSLRTYETTVGTRI